MLCYRCGSYSPEGNRQCLECNAPFSPERRTTPTALRSGEAESAGDQLPFAVGQTIGEHYRLQKLVAREVSGWVIRARDEVSDADVAIRIMDPHLLQRPDERAHFLKTARKGLKLHHANVLRSYEVGTERDLIFFVMPWFEGLTLRKIIDLRAERGQVFSLSEAAPLLSQLAKGLGGLGKLRFHASLSPNNVLVLPDILKLTGVSDFRGLPHGTFMQRLKNRPGGIYVAPEAHDSPERASPRADVYSIAVIAGEMILGVVYGRDPKGWEQSLARQAPALRDVFTRALCAEPRRRYASAELFVSALTSVLEGQERFFPRAASSEDCVELEITEDGRGLRAKQPLSSGPGVETPPWLTSFESASEPDPMPESEQESVLRASSEAPPVSGAGRRFWLLAAGLVCGVLAVAMALSDFAESDTPLEASAKDAPPLVAVATSLGEESPPAAPASKAVEKASKSSKPKGRSPVSAEEKKKSPRRSMGYTPPVQAAMVPRVATSRSSAASKKRVAPAGCPRGMVKVEKGEFVFGSEGDDPMRGFGDLNAARETLGAFCVDIYEYPNRRGKQPTTNVTWSRAKSLCKKRGKRLCSEREWERACKGPAGTRFPTGAELSARACNVSSEGSASGKVAAIGAYSRCRSGYGVADMAGNVAEWTASTWSSGVSDRVVKGGAAGQAGYTARCSARANESSRTRQGHVGFRCCSALK